MNFKHVGIFRRGQCLSGLLPTEVLSVLFTTNRIQYTLIIIYFVEFDFANFNYG